MIGYQIFEIYKESPLYTNLFIFGVSAIGQFLHLGFLFRPFLLVILPLPLEPLVVAESLLFLRVGFFWGLLGFAGVGAPSTRAAWSL